MVWKTCHNNIEQASNLDEQKTRKLMTMHKAIQPRDQIDRFYETRKEGEGEIENAEGYMDRAIQELGEYINKSKGTMITSASNNNNNRIIKIKKIRNQIGKEKTTI